MDNDKKFNEFLAKEMEENPTKINKKIDILDNIIKKYSIEPKDLLELSFLLQTLGYGRNSNTANILRAVADMIESPIETRDSVEARMKGRLQ